MINPNERLLRILQATPDEQARIDRILEGKDANQDHPMSGPLLMGMTDSAKLLGISRATLWRMIQAGRLQKIEILPGSFRIRRSDLLALVQSGSALLAKGGI
jgi:excisionase family DNA binding protein